MILWLILACFAGATLWFVVPRIAEARNNKPPDEFADDFKMDIADRVKLERRKAASIWRASFTEHALLATLCMLGIYAMFIFLDGVFAWYKGGIFAGIVFYFVCFVAIDSIQVSVVSSNDVGAGNAITKKRNIGIYVLLVFGWLLNVYLSQVGYGLFNNIIATASNSQASITSGKIEKAKLARKRLNYLENVTARDVVEIRTQLDSLLLTEPPKQSKCLVTNQKHYGRWSKKNCGTVRKLRIELAQAQERNALRVSVPQLEQANKELGAVATDFDPTATYMSMFFKSQGWNIDKMGASEIFGRVIMIILSTLFPIILFWWSDKANEARERIELERKEKTDLILAKYGYIEDDNGHIRPARPEDAEKHAAALDSAVSSELRGLIEQAGQATPVAGDLMINGMDGLDNDQEIAAVEAFLLQKVSEPMSVQDAFKLWRDAGYGRTMIWFAERARFAVLKTNNLTLENNQIRRSA